MVNHLLSKIRSFQEKMCSLITENDNGQAISCLSKLGMKDNATECRKSCIPNQRPEIHFIPLDPLKPVVSKFMCILWKVSIRLGRFLQFWRKTQCIKIHEFFQFKSIKFHSLPSSKFDRCVFSFTIWFWVTKMDRRKISRSQRISS